MKFHAGFLFAVVATLSLLTSAVYAETIILNDDKWQDVDDHTLSDTSTAVAVLAGGSDDCQLDGTLTLEGNATFKSTDGIYLLLNGTVTGSGNLIKEGSGLSFQGNPSTYTGTTTFNGSDVELWTEDAIKSSQSVTTTAPIHIKTNQTINNLSGTGAVFADVDDVTLTLNYDAETTEYTGQYQGNGNLEKIGSGTLVMANAGDYTGKTTVTKGTLKYTGEPNQNSPIEVKKDATVEFAQNTGIHQFSNAGVTGEGTFRKTGSDTLQIDTTNKPFAVADVKVEAGKLQFSGEMGGNLYITTGGAGESVTSGTFDIGFTTGKLDPTVAKVSVDGNLTLDGGTIQYDFGTYNKDFVPGTDFDTLVLGGSANLNDGTLYFTFAGDSGGETLWNNLSKENGAMYLLMETDDVKLSLDDITLGGVTDGLWQIANTTYKDKQGVFLLAAGVDPPVPPTPDPPVPGSGVPEPSTWALLILGSIGLMYFKRRKETK